MLKNIIKINLLLVLFFLLNNIVFANTIAVFMDYSETNNRFFLNKTLLIDQEPRTEPRKFEHSYKLFSVEDKTLETGYVAIPGFLSSENPPENYSEDKKKVFVMMNYYPTVKHMSVFDLNGLEKIKVDLMQYNRCNLNNICDENENRIICPEDCQDSEKDDICQNVEDGVCEEDPDCINQDPDCIIEEIKAKPIIEDNESEEIFDNYDEGSVSKEKSDSSNNTIKFTLFFLILIIIGLFFVIYYKKQNFKK